MLCSYSEELLSLCEDNVDCVESYLLFLACNDNGKVPDEVLKCALRNAVSLCYARRQLCSRFVGLIASSLLKTPSKLFCIYIDIRVNRNICILHIFRFCS